MTSFLFWNLNKKPLHEVISRLALLHEIDVLMFTEFSIEPYFLLNILNTEESSEFYYAPGIGCERIHIFTRFSDHFIKPLYETDRLTIRHLTLPGLTDILLAVTHFPSKLHWKDSSQAFECVELAKSVRDAEEQVGHSRTILVGDFNMNPFEDGLASMNGLHAVMSRKIAAKRSRVVQGREYPFFYNPMWSLFGDGSPGPPGTYYYGKSEPIVFFWNMFDQLLIRPDLMDFLESKDLLILDSCSNTQFLKSDGSINNKVASDHLPILFNMRL